MFMLLTTKHCYLIIIPFLKVDRWLCMNLTEETHNDPNISLWDLCATMSMSCHLTSSCRTLKIKMLHIDRNGELYVFLYQDSTSCGPVVAGQDVSWSCQTLTLPPPNMSHPNLLDYYIWVNVKGPADQYPYNTKDTFNATTEANITENHLIWYTLISISALGPPLRLITILLNNLFFLN